MTIRPATPADRDGLTDIWLRSVRATHEFLGEADIAELLPIVRDVALAQLDVWVLESAGKPIGFLGMSGVSIEALFLDPTLRRQGGGRRLVDHAQHTIGAGESLAVDVNEQNPAARAFYEAMGFTLQSRSPVDAQGKPFPLLHLRRQPPGA